MTLMDMCRSNAKIAETRVTVARVNLTAVVPAEVRGMIGPVAVVRPAHERDRRMSPEQMSGFTGGRDIVTVNVAENDREGSAGRSLE